MFRIVFIIFITVLFAAQFVPGQSDDTAAANYYKQGIEALASKDTSTAEKYFSKSIREKNNAPAQYELAKIYDDFDSHYKMNVSREHIKEAVRLKPDNPDYHLFYAVLSEKLFKTSKLEGPAEDDAIREYNKVIELDSTNITALENLSSIMLKKFYDLHNTCRLERIGLGNSMDLESDAITKVLAPLLKGNGTSADEYIMGKEYAKQIYDLSSRPLLEMDEIAQGYFSKAEKILSYNIKAYPSSRESYLKLSLLYEDNRQPLKGIPYMLKLTELKPEDTDALLFLGMLYDETSKLDSAYTEFSKAIKLMTPGDKEDFTFNSVKMLIEPLLGNKIKNISDEQLRQLIEAYWNSRDPLNLTKYNERLLEHYSRVAYANLYFSVPRLNLKGWQTDRGKVVIRYGHPLKIIRLLQSFNSPEDDLPRTDIWIYSDKTMSFTDKFRNNKYIFGDNANSQYWDDSRTTYEDLKRVQPEEYHPKFEGPIFQTPNSIAEFKNENNKKFTDIFLNYGLKADSISNLSPNIESSYKAGLFLFNRYYAKVGEEEEEISSFNTKNYVGISNSGNYNVNSLHVTALPDSGNISFELIRNKDKGVASYHFPSKIENYNSDNLMISDLLLASNIGTEADNGGTIKRKDMYILPYPANVFDGKNKIYIYCEIYNLGKNKSGNTNFQQSINVQNVGDSEGGSSIGKMFKSVLRFVGLDKSIYSVSISSSYQTTEEDTQMYVKIDLSSLSRGRYKLTLNVKDNVGGNETSRDTYLVWK